MLDEQSEERTSDGSDDAADYTELWAIWPDPSGNCMREVRICNRTAPGIKGHIRAVVRVADKTDAMALRAIIARGRAAWVARNDH
jgi:hypothetical protein